MQCVAAICGCCLVGGNSDPVYVQTPVPDHVSEHHWAKEAAWLTDRSTAALADVLDEVSEGQQAFQLALDQRGGQHTQAAPVLHPGRQHTGGFFDLAHRRDCTSCSLLCLQCLKMKQNEAHHFLANSST